MRIKSGKGSISIFVLIALLFYIGFLMLLYAGNLNKMQTISERAEAIKAIYAKNFDNVDDVYNRRLAQNDTMQPIIKEIPNSIITNVTQLSDSYEEYGAMGGNTEYIAFNNKFTSLKEVINYSIENNLYGNTNIVINAYGNNGLLTTENKEIAIVRGMKVANESELNTAFSTTGDLYIYVVNNIECTNVISTDNINHKLDLNNNNISYTKQNESFVFLTLGTNSKLIVLDSSREKQGNIVASLIDTASVSDGVDRKNSIFCIRNNGILSIESGTISTKVNQSLIKKTSGSGVDDIGTTIDNFGIVNLNGGSITTDVYTSAVVWAVVVDSVSTARGIVNGGTVNLNAGIITSKAKASMQKAGMVYGRTFAYAYGIVNPNGTINNTNNVVFATEAIANSDGTYKNQTDKGEIVNEAKTT